MTRNPSRLIGLFIVALALGLVGLLSPLAAIVVCTDGLVSIAILFAAFGLGKSILRMLPFEHTSVATQTVLAVAMGTGALSIVTLILGTAGVMTQGVWIAIVASLDAIGVWYVARWVSALRKDAIGTRARDARAGTFAWLTLATAIFLGLGMLAATTPPGLLWPAEGFGYDVLEYHLGAPRDYFDAGRIEYLPHNVYSNFPFNVEMLYLLSMLLRGDPIHAVYTAKLVNLLLGVFAVLAIWRTGARVSAKAGVAAAVLAGTTPFLVYLSGVAYVENGLLFFTAAALLATTAICDGSKGILRRALAAGLLAGFAAGCKYTALPMVAAPIVMFAAVEAIRGRMPRMTPILISLGVVVALAPWLVKNLAATGNPVFPLASKWLGYSDGVWSAEAEQRWIEGHRPQASESGIGHRLKRLDDQLLRSRQFGPIVPIGIALLLGIAGVSLFRQRRRHAVASDADKQSHARSPTTSIVAACGWMVAIGLYVWLFHTHLVDRFAIWLVAPCALVTAIFFYRDEAGRFGRVGVVLIGAIVVFNLMTAWGLFTDPQRPYLEIGAFGHTELMTSEDSPLFPHVAPINQRLASGGRVLMVGDAKRFYLDKGIDYCVVFNRNPFAEAAAKMSPVELLNWLRDRGYSHVYVDWAEMHRLRSTYGFWDSITSELFRRLQDAGLKAEASFSRVPGDRPYSTLFSVPPVASSH